MAGNVWPTPHHNADERELDRLEPSWADFLHGLRTGMRFVRNGTPGLSMHGATYTGVLLQFEAYRQRHEQGDGTALVEALKYACEQGVPAPYWLALEVVPRIARVFSDPVTLHESFGLESDFPSRGKKAANSRRQLKHRQRLWWHVGTLMHWEGLSFDRALRRVLKEHDFPFGPTVARRLFADQERVQRLHLGKTESTTGVQSIPKKRAVFRKV